MSIVKKRDFNTLISEIQENIQLILFEIKKQKNSKKYILRISKLEKLKNSFGVWINDLVELESVSERLLKLFKDDNIINDEFSRIALDKCNRSFFYKIDDITRGV